MTTEPEDDDRIISIGGPLFEPVPEKFYELLRELERVETAPPVFVTPEMIDWAATEIATALGDPSEWQRYRLCAELALHRVAPMFAERFGAAVPAAIHKSATESERKDCVELLEEIERGEWGDLGARTLRFAAEKIRTGEHRRASSSDPPHLNENGRWSDCFQTGSFITSEVS